ncbi:hypothetical protein [Amycolatopsis sp. cmx-11-12]|uniref:hypothetical protein n=1 Tax=Amycolatopsis sp. cmx-11-12 TaxID=2785795 RepID=UPI0039182041
MDTLTLHVLVLPVDRGRRRGNRPVEQFLANGVQHPPLIDHLPGIPAATMAARDGERNSSPSDSSRIRPSSVTVAS